MKNAELTDLEKRIHSIVQAKRGEAMVFAEAIMIEAYKEISDLLKTESLRGINQKIVNGISIETLHFLYKCEGTGAINPTHLKLLLTEFIQAKSLAFNSQKLIYPNFMMKWGDEEDKQLLELWLDGKSAEELSEIFGRHPKSILKRIEKLLTPNK